MSSEEFPQPAEKRVTYRSCLGALAIMLILAVLPIIGCRLATVGSMEFGQLPDNYVNIFLMQEPGKEGLGIQRTREVGSGLPAGSCTRTSVRFFMLAGEAENNDSCTCQIDPGSIPGGSAPALCQIPNS